MSGGILRLAAAITIGFSIAMIGPTGAQAQQTPDVIFGIEDADQDGTPDGFSSSGLANAISDRFTERRTFAEFSFIDAPNLPIGVAMLSGSLEEEFSFGFGAAPAAVFLVGFGGLAVGGRRRR